MADTNGTQGAGGPEFSELSELERDIIKRKEKKRAQRKAKRKLEDKGGLTITSLMDAMVILLIFLLVSITSDPLNVKQDDNLVLARSTVDYSPHDDSIPITITKTHIVVDSQGVVQVECTIDGHLCSNDPDANDRAQGARPETDIQALNYCQELPPPDDCTPEDLVQLRKRMRFRIDKSYKGGSDEQFLIGPLQKRLQQLVREQKEENVELRREFKGVTTIIADRDIPFRILAEVVHTAGMAELSDIRFAVLKTGER